MASITVIGAGSWGTALAKMLGSKGHEVVIWSIDQHEVDMINIEREQKDKLPGIKLPDSIRATTNMEEACTALNPELVIFAVPSIYVRETAIKLRNYLKKDQILLNVAKGVEETSLKTITQVIESEIPNLRLCTMSGPSHAEEVARDIATVCVVASKDRDAAEHIQNMLSSDNFRLYTSSDMIGVELGGSLKNVIALATGIAEGLGGGDNTRAALITRGMAEIARLGIKMGGRVETFYGLSGIGDLIVTCGSKHSRNFRAGVLLGKGFTMKQVNDQINMVIEGVNSAKAILRLAKRNAVELPITEEVNEVLFYNKKPEKAMKALMTRDKKTESSFMPW